MNTGKKTLSLLLVLIMLMSLLPVQVLAQEEAPAIPDIQLSLINPNVPEELVPQLPAREGEVAVQQPRAGTDYTDAYGARYSIRDAMIARQEHFEIHFKMFFSPDWSQEVFTENLTRTLEEAMNGALSEETNPKAGDYLGFHFIYLDLVNLVDDDIVSNYLYLTATFEAAYFTTAAQEKEVDKAVDNLLAQLNLSGKSDYEKVRAVYDYMTDNIVYDYAALTDPNELLAFSTYGALIEGEAVCQGYASLFYRMMKELGVGVRAIPGIGFNGENYELHAWNIVKLDGKYYNLDSTWDAIYHQAGLDYEFFLRGSKYFPDHIREETYDSAQFHSSYPMSAEDYPIPADSKQFQISFANMTLGNSLAMNFAFEKGHRADWSGCYAQIVKEYADGRPDKVVKIPYSQWGSANISGVAHFTLKFDGVAAKEMSDNVYVTIYDANGKAISKVWEDSVRSYAMRTLNNASSDQETKIMIVDLLNYGAAAQSNFNYNTGNLANNQLTSAQKALATKSAKAVDSRVKGANYKGTNLGLESQILMRMAFGGTTKDMYAIISFTSHTGKVNNIRVEGSEFASNGGAVVIDEIVIADGRQPVTITVYNADGTVHGSATDSLESYIARMSDAGALYEMILKFSDSAYNFFH